MKCTRCDKAAALLLDGKAFCASHYPNDQMRAVPRKNSNPEPKRIDSDGK